jgi:transcriptional regulator with XRE-family HTH domain
MVVNMRLGGRSVTSSSAHFLRYSVAVHWTQETIKARRVELNLSQKALADRIGVSLRTVTAWETGESEPQLRYRRALDEVLGTVEDTQSVEPTLRGASNAQLIAEIVRRIEGPEFKRDRQPDEGFSRESLGIEDKMPPGLLNDPNLIEIDPPHTESRHTIRRRQAGSGP